MSRFGTDPQRFFAGVYQDVAPWDIGDAQPAMKALLEEFPPSAPVLDAGCGSGDLTLHLAKGGYDALGIDFVEAAIEQARSKARALAPEASGRATFEVADALRPSLLGRQFGAVVDSGFLHLLTPGQSDHYLEEIRSVLRGGGRLYLQEFASEFDMPNTPRKITEGEVRARFTTEKGWRILTLRSGEFLSRFAPVPATLACIERTPEA